MFKVSLGYEGNSKPAWVILQYPVSENQVLEPLLSDRALACMSGILGLTLITGKNEPSQTRAKD